MTSILKMYLTNEHVIQSVITMLICVALYSHWVYKKFSIWIALPVFWALSWGTFEALNHYNVWRAFGLPVVNKINLEGLKAVFYLSMILWATRKYNLIKLFIGIASLDSICTWINYLTGFKFMWSTAKGISNGPYGFIGHPSICGIFMVIALPFIFRLKGYWRLLAIPVISAIILTGQSVPLMALAVCIISYTFLTVEDHYKQLIIMGTLLAMLIALISYLPDEFSSSSILHNDRYLKYKEAMSYIFSADFFRWQGTGIGTYWKIGPMIKSADPQIFLFLHSDVLQTIFEMGIIGFLLVCGGIVDTLKTAWRNDRWLVCPVLTFLSTTVFSFPLRYAFTSIVGAIILSSVYKKKVLQ